MQFQYIHTIVCISFVKGNFFSIRVLKTLSLFIEKVTQKDIHQTKNNGGTVYVFFLFSVFYVSRIMQNIKTDIKIHMRRKHKGKSTVGC